MLTKRLRVVMAGAAIAVASLGLPEMALAQATPESAQPQFLTDAQVRERYQNCPDGYYSGPRPGKARYTKDPWFWVVTPEFAQRFCMPPEFVSTELKGAEAIAYKLVEDEDEELCGWGGRAVVCRKATDHRFEIYYKTGAIPKQQAAPYFHTARLPSAMLLTQTEKSWQATRKSLQTKPRLGARSPFFSQQFGFQAIKNGKVVADFGALRPRVHYEEVFEGHDYVAIEGGSGFSLRDIWTRANSQELVVAVRRDSHDQDWRAVGEMPLSEYALVIRLPARLVEHVVQTDQKRGLNLRALAQDALNPNPPKNRAEGASR